jgi:hypothetical protein
MLDSGAFSKRESMSMWNTFGFIAHDVALLAMTAPTDSLMTDWVVGADMLVVMSVL